MKSKLLLLCIFVIALSCSDEEVAPTPTPDFDFTLEGEAPDATLKLINKSQNATSYRWFFSAGTEKKFITEESPSIKIDKAGEFNVHLYAYNGNNRETLGKKVLIGGKSAVLCFTNISFGIEEGKEEYGNFFSTSTGEMYSKEEIDSEAGKEIDLVFLSSKKSEGYFTSPDEEEEIYKIPNATFTAINHNVPEEFDETSFENIKDETGFKNVSVQDDGLNNIVKEGELILFQNSKGKIGVIKVKSYETDHVTVDIKVQKY